jgi:hypothetical protein
MTICEVGAAPTPAAANTGATNEALASVNGGEHLYRCANCGPLPIESFQPSFVRRNIHKCRDCQKIYQRGFHAKRKAAMASLPEAERQAALHVQAITRFLNSKKRELELTGAQTAPPPALETVAKILATLTKTNERGQVVKFLLRPKDPSKALDEGNFTWENMGKHAIDAALRSGRWGGWKRAAAGKKPDRRSLRRRLQKLIGSTEPVVPLLLARPAEGPTPSSCAHAATVVSPHN